MLYDTVMVTSIYKGRKGRLYLKEHRKAKGVSAVYMAGRLGIARESVYRLEREFWRASYTDQLAYADALDIEPRRLWSPPERPSLDDRVAGQPDEIVSMADDIVRRLVAGRGK